MQGRQQFSYQPWVCFCARHVSRRLAEAVQRVSVHVAILSDWRRLYRHAGTVYRGSWQGIPVAVKTILFQVGNPCAANYANAVPGHTCL